MLAQGMPYGLECVNGVVEPASASGYEEGTKGLSRTLYVVQGKNNYFLVFAKCKCSEMLCLWYQNYNLSYIVAVAHINRDR